MCYRNIKCMFCKAVICYKQLKILCSRFTLQHLGEGYVASLKDGWVEFVCDAEKNLERKENWMKGKKWNVDDNNDETRLNEIPGHTELRWKKIIPSCPVYA